MPSTLPSATASSPAAAASTPPPAGDPEPDGGTSGTVGNSGIGDPYYPLAGNGGYQVDSYNINLSYDPDSNALQSTAQIKGAVTGPDGLSQFNLDLQPTMTVSAVTVNGAPATFEHDDAELVITPATLLPAQSDLAVEVTYAGQPGPIPGGTGGGSDGGWYRTESGRRLRGRRTGQRVRLVPGERTPRRHGHLRRDGDRAAGLAGDLQRAGSRRTGCRTRAPASRCSGGSSAIPSRAT